MMSLTEHRANLIVNEHFSSVLAKMYQSEGRKSWRATCDKSAGGLSSVHETSLEQYASASNSRDRGSDDENVQ